MEQKNEKKPTLWERLLRIWYAILSVFHLMTVGQHNKACEVINSLHDSKVLIMENSLSYKESVIGTLTEDINALNEKLAQSEEECRKIRSKIDAYKATASVNLDYVKDTQKALGEVLGKTPEFGFPKRVAIPGSSTMTKDIKTLDDGEEYSVIRVRLIAPDNITAIINQEPDMATRVGILLKQMDIFETSKVIGETLLNNGAVRLILAYNKNCTNYELFAEVVAKNCYKDSYLVIEGDNTTTHVPVVEAEEEKKEDPEG